LICSVALGKMDKDIVVDVDKEEEDFEEGEGATDIPTARLGKSGRITLLQLDGKIQPEKMKEVFKLSKEACRKIYDVQKKALKEVVESQ